MFAYIITKIYLYKFRREENHYKAQKDKNWAFIFGPTNNKRVNFLDL